MSAPTWKDVERAKETAVSEATSLERESSIYTLPQGYVRGFYLRATDQGTLEVGTGMVEVAGKTIRNAAARNPEPDDWECKQIAGYSYYLYVDADGKFHIDVVDYAWRGDLMADYHVVYNWRYLGRFTLDDDGLVDDVVNQGAIRAEEIEAEAIQTKILYINEYGLVIGQDYSDDPVVGSQAIVADQNELRLVEWDGTQWVTITKFGGDDELKWYLQSRGLIKTGADISGLEIGEVVPSGTAIYDFEDDYEDQDANDPWDLKADLAFTTSFKFGAKALTHDTGLTGHLSDHEALGVPGVDFGLSFWHYKPSVQTERLSFLASDEFTLVGSGLSIVGITGPALASLSEDTVAYIDATLKELRTYRWDGSNWSMLGSGLSIANVDWPALAALNDTDVALTSFTLDELRTYRWNGATWSQVGSGLAIAGIGAPALAAITETDVAFLDSLIQELRTYRWSGSAWSQVGNGLNIPGASNPKLATLTETDVAFIDDLLEKLRTYQWDGTDWSMVGAELAIAGIDVPALAALTETCVAFIDETIEELRTYQWSGAAWSQVGSGLSIAGISAPALAALSETSVAFIDATLEELRTYHLDGFCLWETPTGYRLVVDGDVETTRAATAGQWHHVGITSRDVAGQKKWGFAVDSWSTEDDTAAYPVTADAWIDFYLRDGAIIDDLAVLADDDGLGLGEMTDHCAANQPWVDEDTGIDYLLDLILMARAGGKIRLLSDALFAEDAEFLGDVVFSGDVTLPYYDTGWINRSDWTNVHLGSDDTLNADSNVTHNLDAPLSELVVKVLVSTDGTDANSFEIGYTDYAPSAATRQYNYQVYAVDDDNVRVQTGAEGLMQFKDADGLALYIDTENWYYKIKVWRLG